MALKVWIVNQYAVAPSEPGGLRPFSLAKELVHLGHDVTLVASSFNHWTRVETRLKDGQNSLQEVIEGVRMMWLRAPAYPGSTIKRFASMMAFSQNVFQSPDLRSLGAPDVIIGSNPHIFSAFRAMKLAQDLDASFIFEVRDIWPQSLVDLGRMSERHPLILVMKHMERQLIRNAQAIVTLPPTSSQYYEANGLDPKSLFWIPNGVYLPTLPDAPPLQDQNSFTIIFAGIHGIANSLDTVLEAANLLRDTNIIFRLLGDGGEKNHLVEKAKQLQLDNVIFSEPVPKSQVAAEIAKADAGLLILKKSPVFRWGVSPNKLFDYFGAGRPVLYAVEASNNPVEEAQAGLTVLPENPEDLALKALALSRLSLEERQRMGTNGRRYVEQHHDLSKLGRVLERAVIHATQKFQEHKR